MLAVGGSLFLLKEVGFVAERSGDNSATALLTLQLMFCLGPAALALAAAWLINGYRLDATAHALIRRKLDARDEATLV